MAKSNLEKMDKIKRAWPNQTLKRWIGLNEHGQTSMAKSNLKKMDNIKRAWPNQTLKRWIGLNEHG